VLADCSALSVYDISITLSSYIYSITVTYL
jgi:hypothetical protein